MDLSDEVMDYEDDTQNWATLQEKQQHYADLRDCLIRKAGPTEALIDIDSEEAFAIFLHRWETFKRAEPAPSVRWSKAKSPSGKFGHWHIVVEMGRVLEPFERLWIQAILGDDPLRGLLSYAEARTYGEPAEVSILFTRYTKLVGGT